MIDDGLRRVDSAGEEGKRAMLPGVDTAAARRPLSFAAAVESHELTELRFELLREARHWLTVWTETRDERAAGRLFQALESVKLTVGGGS